MLSYWRPGLQTYLLRICTPCGADTAQKCYWGCEEGGGGSVPSCYQADDACGAGAEPFWSQLSLVQVHAFIFVIAVTHLAYAGVAMALCLWKLGRWRRYEAQAQELRPLRAWCVGRGSVWQEQQQCMGALLVHSMHPSGCIAPVTEIPIYQSEAAGLPRPSRLWHARSRMTDTNR